MPENRGYQSLAVAQLLASNAAALTSGEGNKAAALEAAKLFTYRHSYSACGRSVVLWPSSGCGRYGGSSRSHR